MERPPAKLLDRARYRIRLKGYSIRTEQSYVSWIRRIILFHNKRHPQDMGKDEIEEYLTYLAVSRPVAPSTQNQAFNALLFLYRNVLEIEFPENISAYRSKRLVRLPTVLFIFCPIEGIRSGKASNRGSYRVFESKYRYP